MKNLKNGRSPHIAVPSAGVLVASAYMLLTGDLPVSVSTAADSHYLTVFLLMMLVGSLVALVSYFVRGTEFSLNVELAGLMSLSFSVIIYGIMILTYGEFRVTVGGSLAIALGISCVMRMVEIHRKFRESARQAELCRKHMLDAEKLMARSEDDEGRHS